MNPTSTDTSASPAWRVVSIVETTGIGAAGQISSGKKITAQVQGGLGTTFSAFVPDDRFTAANAKEALDEAYRHISGVEGLTG